MGRAPPGVDMYAVDRRHARYSCQPCRDLPVEVGVNHVRVNEIGFRTPDLVANRAHQKRVYIRASSNVLSDDSSLRECLFEQLASYR